MSVVAIILAAGGSRRLGRPKQLLIYRGETLLEQAVRRAHESGASPVLVVLGAQFETIRASLSLNDAVIVCNENWEQGLATSIHAGLRAMDGCAIDASGVLIMGCDQPRLSADHLRSLIALFDARAEAAIVASSYAGVEGMPAVFPRAVFAELLSLRGDRGARALIARAQCQVVSLALEGGEVDIDLPGDIAQLE
jgi:molybdenum cofactor cytidylyltransferase